MEGKSFRIKPKHHERNPQINSVFIVSLAVGCNVTYYPDKSMFTLWIFPGAMKKHLKAQQAAEESQEASQCSAEPFHEEEWKFIQFWNMTEVQLLFMICVYL